MKITPLILAAVVAAAAGIAHAETITKQGKNSAGQTCTVTVNRSADGSMTTAAGAGTATGAGGLSSSSAAGGTSVQVQAGGGSVSSSTTMPGSSGTTTSSSASTITVNGCTVSTSSP